MELFSIRYHRLLILIMQCTCMLNCCVNTAIAEVTVELTKQEAGKGLTIRHRSTILDKYTNLFKRIVVKTKMLHARMKRSTVHRSGSCSGLCERSLCPWKITVDRDPNRIPEFIENATCITRTCQFPKPSYEMELSTTCETIKRDILVYKDNRYTFERKWPVACACTKKSVSRGQISTSKGSQILVGNGQKKRRIIAEHKLKNRKQRKARLLNKKRRRKISLLFKSDLPWFYEM